jgi:hypothetical protein
VEIGDSEMAGRRHEANEGDTAFKRVVGYFLDHEKPRGEQPKARKRKPKKPSTKPKKGPSGC